MRKIITYALLPIVVPMIILGELATTVLLGLARWRDGK